MAVLVEVPALGTGVTLPGASAASRAGHHRLRSGRLVEAEVEALLDGAADVVSAARSAAAALAGDGLLNATPSIPAITRSPAAPAASAARRARARLRA